MVSYRTKQTTRPKIKYIQGLGKKLKKYFFPTIFLTKLTKIRNL
jgi:hypothetical protein